VINLPKLLFVALNAELDALGGPYAHAFGLELGKGAAAALVDKAIAALLAHILLRAEKAARPVNGYAPDFFFKHVHHLFFTIQQISKKRK